MECGDVINEIAVGKCASVYQGKIMQEILEFSEIEILEKNPNPVNDIYKKNGAEGVAYPGAVTEVEDYRTRCGTVRVHSTKWQNTFDCTQKKESKR